jgi:hypothetical protein
VNMGQLDLRPNTSVCMLLHPDSRSSSHQSSRKALSKPQLSDHCKTFKLRYTGNMATLTNRLEDFSKDKSRWERCAFFHRN